MMNIPTQYLTPANSQASSMAQAHGLANPAQPAQRPGGGGRIAVIEALWHHDIVARCRASFIEEMARAGYPAAQTDCYQVPGAFEIPLHAKLLAASGRYDAVACVALVVDGGVYRHDFVAQSVVSGLMQVQLETQVPVFSAVLTPHHFHSHDEHQRFFSEHFAVKGVELAQACVGTLAALRRLAAPQRHETLACA
jgi:6,7-dimethyl-8-ribityllumazine synthase